MKNIVYVTAAAASLALSAPLHAQVSENPQTLEPMDQNQAPGLQQTPEGQTMKMAVEKDKGLKEGQAAQTGVERPTTSTGPTFPNDKPAK
jgi:hypothetical protein